MGIAHYFSIVKAKKQLGYMPTKRNDMSPVVEWFIERGYRKEKKSNTLLGLLLNILLAVVIVSVVLSLLPIVT